MHKQISTLNERITDVKYRIAKTATYMYKLSDNTFIFTNGMCLLILFDNCITNTNTAQACIPDNNICNSSNSALSTFPIELKMNKLYMPAVIMKNDK